MTEGNLPGKGYGCCHDMPSLRRTPTEVRRRPRALASPALADWLMMPGSSDVLMYLSLSICMIGPE